ncbi:hydrolase [Pontibacillus halophilus JSM 076056 = DSM 19796]|uniref:Hydrolase n=1 Tax=Pontibacillus halophilus JSM 076056 = DSM 19796 TaxID=1385510 RepID=A0A0A5GII5_9BACI|nr:amidase [Pontibacillus halophilus]KGX90945.1 hydrolase [Pontibacillus halophilus JSM 076056 = DSM 19796]
MDLTNYDALGLKELLDRGEVTAEQLLTHYIEVMKQMNPGLNAVIHEFGQDALQKISNQSFAKGGLHGLPFLVKDLNNVAGYPASSGSKLMQGFVPDEDDELVRRYREAGLVFFGKTNTPEYGFLPTTEPLHFGPTLNPWDRERSAGGSSGGAAAAVATGMAPFAHASDGGGSIRIPASACGVFGLKPSRGRIPYAIYMNDYAVSHALTRSVRDSAALLDVIKGSGRGEGYPLLDQQTSFLEESKKAPRRLKIALSYDWSGQVAIADEVRQSLNKTVELLQSLGHEVEEIEPKFDFEQYARDFCTVWIASGAVIIKHMGMLSGNEPSEESLEPLSYQVYLDGERVSAMEYEEARVRLQRVAKMMAMYQEEYDLLLTPVLNVLPAKVGKFNHQRDPMQDMVETMTHYVSFSQLANVTGQPSMSVPLYWTEEGIPIGSQFTGALGEEATLLQLATELEQAKPWFHKYKELTT